MVLRLANGSTTEDSRFDWLPDWDDRNDDYPVSGALTVRQQDKPKSYTWKISTLLDQGEEGACVGFSFAHELIARPTVWGLSDLDARCIYYQAQMIDQWPGGDYPGASPKMSGTSILAAVKVLTNYLGYFESYRWARNADDLALAVGHIGPAILGCSWHESMIDTDSDGFITPSGRVVGGHAIVVNGVNVKGQYFTLTNSWGPSWGVDGAAKLAFADLNRLLSGSGEACIPVGRVKPQA